jgi:hypothetical protein
MGWSNRNSAEHPWRGGSRQGTWRNLLSGTLVLDYLGSPRMKSDCLLVKQVHECSRSSWSEKGKKRVWGAFKEREERRGEERRGGEGDTIP